MSKSLFNFELFHLIDEVRISFNFSINFYFFIRSRIDSEGCFGLFIVFFLALMHRQHLSFKIGCFSYLTPLTLSKQLVSTVLSKQTWNIPCFSSSDDSLWWMEGVTYDQYFKKQREFEGRSSKLTENKTFLLLLKSLQIFWKS